MYVNLSKTKIAVFRKGVFLYEREKWKRVNDYIEVVNCYKYLEIHATTKLSLNQTVKAKIRTIHILSC